MREGDRLALRSLEPRYQENLKRAWISPKPMMIESSLFLDLLRVDLDINYQLN